MPCTCDLTGWPQCTMSIRYVLPDFWNGEGNRNLYSAPDLGMEDHLRPLSGQLPRNFDKRKEEEITDNLVNWYLPVTPTCLQSLLLFLLVPGFSWLPVLVGSLLVFPLFISLSLCDTAVFCMLWRRTWQLALWPGEGAMLLCLQKMKHLPTF